MTESGVVRFITPDQEDEEGPAASRTESPRPCYRCRREHQYELGLISAHEDAPAEQVLIDSWEDAAYRVRQWLPDVPPFLGRREPDDENESEAFLFDTRAEAIRWLLEVPA